MSGTASPGSIRAGGAYVELFTVDSKFHQGLAKAQQSLRNFSAAALKTGAALSAASAAIAAGLLANAKAFADNGSALSDMSQRTGMAVESLSALGYAAEQSGTSLDKLEDSLKDMSKNIAEAASGSQGVIDTFNQLGVSVGSLQGIGAEKQFMKIADALAEVPDVGDRAAKAMKIFGEGGRQLIPMLAGGSAGVKRLMKDAQELGLVMSAQDAAAAAKLKDEIDKLSAAFEALKNTIGASVAGELTDFLNYLNEASPAILKSIGENKEWIVWLGNMSIKMGAVGIAMGGLGTAAYALSTAITVLRTATIGLSASLGAIAGLGVLAGLVLITDEVVKQITAQDDLNRELKRSIDLREKLAQVGSGQTKKTVEESREHGGEDRDAFLQQNIESEQKNLEAKKKRVKELQDEADSLDTKAKKARTHDISLSKKYEREAVTVRSELADEQSIMDTTQSRIDALQKEQEAYRAEQKDMDRSPHQSDMGQSSANLTYKPEELAQAPGLGFTIGDGVQAAAEQQRKDAAKLRQSLEQEAESVAEAMLTPAEKLKKRLAHLEKLKEHGLSDEDFDRAVKAANAEAGLDQAKSTVADYGNRTTNAAAMQQGSSEAFSSMVQAMQGREQVEKQIEKNTKDSAKDLKFLARDVKSRNDGVTIKQMTMA